MTGKGNHKLERADQTVKVWPARFYVTSLNNCNGWHEADVVFISLGRAQSVTIIQQEGSSRCFMQWFKKTDNSPSLYTHICPQKIVQPFSQPFIIVDSQRQNGWRVLLSNPSGWFSRDFPFRVFLFTMISCKQVQALVRLLAELSCLAQTLFCLSQPLWRDCLLAPGLIRLNGWIAWRLWKQNPSAILPLIINHNEGEAEGLNDFFDFKTAVSVSTMTYCID